MCSTSRKSASGTLFALCLCISTIISFTGAASGTATATGAGVMPQPPTAGIPQSAHPNPWDMPMGTPGIQGMPSVPANKPATSQKPDVRGLLKEYIPEGIEKITGIDGMNVLLVRTKSLESLDKLRSLINLLEKPKQGDGVAQSLMNDYLQGHVSKDNQADDEEWMIVTPKVTLPLLKKKQLITSVNMYGTRTEQTTEINNPADDPRGVEDCYLAAIKVHNQQIYNKFVMGFDADELPDFSSPVPVFFNN